MNVYYIIVYRDKVRIVNYNALPAYVPNHVLGTITTEFSLDLQTSYELTNSFTNLFHSKYVVK